MQAMFDTLDYANAMKDAGFNNAQAEAMAKAQGKLYAHIVNDSGLAKTDDILRLEKQMAEMEIRITKTLHGAIYTLAGVIIAAIAVAVAILK